MTSRKPLTADFPVPGPGSYCPNHNFKKITYSVGHADRKTNKFSEVPGPASYDIQSDHSQGIVFGSSERAFLIENQSFPGPGSYENSIK